MASPRWEIAPDGSIVWRVKKGDFHSDHLEMSGQQMSVVLRYGVKADGAFSVNRSFVFPMLRMKPNKTGSNLKQRWDVDVARMVTVDDLTLLDEHVDSISLRGLMKVESTFAITQRRKIVPNAVRLSRTLYPSPTKACYIEEDVYENLTDKSMTLRVPDINLAYHTPREKGVYGAYKVQVTSSRNGFFTLKPNDKLRFHVYFTAQMEEDKPLTIDADAELTDRLALIDQWHDNLILETPDKVLNTMFAFAKIRGAESIYLTRGGFMHGPGGEAYYAAIWANDQAEYINPFFPFLGYEVGNSSALNSYRHFARFMNDAY